MTQRPYDKALIRRLRNDIPMDWLIGHIGWPNKRQGKRFVFVCPECQESDSNINPSTNLGRCFRCERNFNPIDFLMSTHHWEFTTVVEYLTPLLPSLPR